MDTVMFDLSEDDVVEFRTTAPAPLAMKNKMIQLEKLEFFILSVGANNAAGNGLWKKIEKAG